MNRKGDIELAYQVYIKARLEMGIDDALVTAFGLAYDLGRAAQAESDIKRVAYRQIVPLRNFAEHLRALVRKLTGDTR